ncbi:hypothetical protein BC938DRAFT_484298 [Jimgerdemannia flammicorona]|uniref:Uncharacterized protein n=1 Tax=Jimgerdemannia flammicorona TaxID=994334 RepID=A0A433QA99_9FUNG|nr:hypothetical protein BC938DRAFT_484298 [Jimgerdemannia flammicorona]
MERFWGYKDESRLLRTLRITASIIIIILMASLILISGRDLVNQQASIQQYRETKTTFLLQIF